MCCKQWHLLALLLTVWFPDGAPGLRGFRFSLEQHPHLIHISGRKLTPYYWATPTSLTSARAPAAVNRMAAMAANERLRMRMDRISILNAIFRQPAAFNIDVEHALQKARPAHTR